jgi:hypothetical protein
MVTHFAWVLDVDEDCASIGCLANACDLAARWAHQESGDLLGSDVGHEHLVVALVDEVTCVGKAAICLNPEAALVSS